MSVTFLRRRTWVCSWPGRSPSCCELPRGTQNSGRNLDMSVYSHLRIFSASLRGTGGSPSPMYTPVLGADGPALPAAGSKVHIVAAGPMPEGSSPELLGFSHVPNGGASGSIATVMPARASDVGIVPKPASKRGRRRVHCLLTSLLPGVTNNGPPLRSHCGWRWQTCLLLPLLNHHRWVMCLCCAGGQLAPCGQPHWWAPPGQSSWRWRRSWAVPWSMPLNFLRDLVRTPSLVTFGQDYFETRASVATGWSMITHVLCMHHACVTLPINLG